MKKHYDTAVIGGGIIGCAISYELAKTQQKVVLLEAGEVGRKTTSAAAGMLGAHAECENRDAFLILPCTVKGCMNRRGKSLRKLAALTSGAITAECLNWRIPKKISPVYGRWMICLPSPGFQRKMPLKKSLTLQKTFSAQVL